MGIEGPILNCGSCLRMVVNKLDIGLLRKEIRRTVVGSEDLKVRTAGWKLN